MDGGSNPAASRPAGLDEPGLTPVPLEWSFNPWRDRPGRAVTAAAVAVLLCGAILGLREPLLLETVLCVAVVATLSPVLSPANLRVDEQGVSRRGPFGLERRPWSEVRRAVSGPPGVLLSPYPRPHWLDPYRGLWLPLPRRDGEALLAELRRHLSHHGL
jgi:hypothetical protein